MQCGSFVHLGVILFPLKQPSRIMNHKIYRNEICPDIIKLTLGQFPYIYIEYLLLGFMRVITPFFIIRDHLVVLTC
jgi:hypothetical protein